MTITPGGNPVCDECGRGFCLCMTDEQAVIANALMAQNYLSSRPIAKDFAAVALNALAEAGYDVVRADVEPTPSDMVCKYCGRWLAACVESPCDAAHARQGLRK